ncbi:four helix bundle protein [Sulfurovum lithotrophicum]|nr:four helix bundle protein [Sulfurovum lithotrophicum]
MSKSIIADKSYAFAIRIVKLFKYLKNEHNEYVLSKQLLRSGTAIGALVREAEFAQSKADFINKLSIGLKEANETDYWINLLYDTEYITQAMHQDIQKDVKELIKLLVAIVKSSKEC